MKISQLVGRTLKETPREAELVSHKLLLRAGYMRQFSTGIYGLLPLAQRSMLKIEKIIREEMNAVDGQEIKMPCMMTKELWDESGRYTAIGKDMFRLKDRNDKPVVLGMTHEEPVVAFARTELTSYKQLPAMMYQVQTKFRDEPRPRGGLIRLREFIMKDAYSFHETEECLSAYYKRVHDAYMKIFFRAGCKNFASVKSDNGMFGGTYSHEFIMLVPSGEDTIITCTSCTYKANVEVAEASKQTYLKTAVPGSTQELELLPTPGQKSIDDLCRFLHIKPQQTCKCVLYVTKKNPHKLIAVFLRGDREVSETKLRDLLQDEPLPAENAVIEAAGVVPGSAGPVGLDFNKVTAVFDFSVCEGFFYTGANKKDYHYAGYSFARDSLPDLDRAIQGDFAVVKAGDCCPDCGADLQETRGIEIGNIFNLGTRYSASMGATYQDSEGQVKNHIMGCYGIGVTRLLPSVIEENHDKFGMILPITIAPFDIHFCVLSSFDERIGTLARDLYKNLSESDIDVLLDDRDEKPGTQFADADLIGIPIRIVLSPKSLQQDALELKFRDQREPSRLLPLATALDELKKIVVNEYNRYLPK